MSLYKRHSHVLTSHATDAMQLNAACAIANINKKENGKPVLWQLVRIRHMHAFAFSIELQ